MKFLLLVFPYPAYPIPPWAQVNPSFYTKRRIWAAIPIAALLIEPFHGFIQLLHGEGMQSGIESHLKSYTLLDPQLPRLLLCHNIAHTGKALQLIGEAIFISFG